MDLPSPCLDGDVSLEQAVLKRRTVRSFAGSALTPDQFSQILWAAQGITNGRFKRAAPSAGALYPADLYAAVGEGCAGDWAAGVYHYRPGNHSVNRVSEGDRRRDLAGASLGQMWMADAPAQFVLTAAYGRITGKYGERGIRYALMEVGHIAQNIMLQCQSIGLAAGIVGAFHDREVVRVLGIGEENAPLLILPVGCER